MAIGMSVSKMASTSLELEGRTLGEKHRNYNELIKQAIANKTVIEPGDLNSGENDVEHLMKIDLASNDRDVEYILKVLKCEDIMYVSRAIKQSKWIVEKQYAHIINPTYLHTHLFLEMTVNAKTEFMKHLRLNLQDEARAEQFFNYEVQCNVKNAVIWLPNCSNEFIVLKAQEYLLKSKNWRLFKRLCEKTPDVLQVLLHDDAKYITKKLIAAKFLLHSALEKYLDVVEKLNDFMSLKFGIKQTDLLMQKCPNRIIDKFDKYFLAIHMPTFVTHLKKNEIKDFLFSKAKDAKNDSCVSLAQLFFNSPKYVKYFIDAMTAERRSEFLDQVFINKIHSNEDAKEESEKYAIRKFYLLVTERNSEYIYYDFNTAFDKITKKIKNSESQDEKLSLLQLLVKCAGCDSRKIQTVLKYYHEKHAKDPLKSTEVFLKSVLPKINISKLDAEFWRILDGMFKRLKAYSAVAGCVEMVIVCKIIHGENIPKEIEEEFMKNYTHTDTQSHLYPFRGSRSVKGRKKRPMTNYNTLKSYQKSLNNEQKEKVFKYLYDRIMYKIENIKITNETEFKKGVSDLKYALTLLNDWEKDLSDFSWVLDKIKEYLKIKKDNSWKSSMASVYNTNKKWKKLMFEESIELCPSETVCLNVLKHNNQLLSLDRGEVNALRCNNKISLQRLLKKLRTYWPNTLAAEWTQLYLDAVHQQKGDKAVVRGLCALLPRQQLLQLIHNYAPKQEKIVYSELENIPLNVQRQLAKSMLIARPRPPPDAILLYAKGDYLQYALPSLLAIFNNANLSQTRNLIPKLLSGHVSLQKHGIRIVSAKFTPKEALNLFKEIWMSTSNATIRAVVFKFTFSLLDKDKTLQRDVWEVLFLFIRNLTHDEDKSIYEILTNEKNISKMPENLIPEYIMTLYKFLNELIPKLPDKDQTIYQWKVSTLIQRTKYFIEHLPSAFVLDILSMFIEDIFMKKEITAYEETISVITAFVLCSKGDKTQIERYNLLLLPLLQRCVSSWDKNFIRKNVDKLLNRLTYALKNYVLEKEMDIPLSIFEEVQKQLLLPMPDNYIILTKWKLTVELTRILHRKGFINSDWDKTCVDLAPEVGMKCLNYLKSEVTSYFPCIYLHFSKALTIFFESNDMPTPAKIIILQCLLSDARFIQGYLSVIKMFPLHFDNEPQDVKEKCEQLRNHLCEHPAIEVKMHYTHMFKGEV